MSKSLYSKYTTSKGTSLSSTLAGTTNLNKTIQKHKEDNKSVTAINGGFDSSITNGYKSNVTSKPKTSLKESLIQGYDAGRYQSIINKKKEMMSLLSPKTKLELQSSNLANSSFLQNLNQTSGQPNVQNISKSKERSFISTTSYGTYGFNKERNQSNNLEQSDYEVEEDISYLRSGSMEFPPKEKGTNYSSHYKNAKSLILTQEKVNLNKTALSSYSSPKYGSIDNRSVYKDVSLNSSHILINDNLNSSKTCNKSVSSSKSPYLAPSNSNSTAQNNAKYKKIVQSYNNNKAKNRKSESNYEINHEMIDSKSEYFSLDTKNSEKSNLHEHLKKCPTESNNNLAQYDLNYKLIVNQIPDDIFYENKRYKSLKIKHDKLVEDNKLCNEELLQLKKTVNILQNYIKIQEVN